MSILLPTPRVPEHSTVRWGTTTIPYTIQRSGRRATISLAIDPLDGLLVPAPAATPVPKLDAVVKGKARWVVERIRRSSERPPAVASREFVTGETFSYLGRAVRLRLVRATRTPAPRAHDRTATLRGGWLYVTIPRVIDERHRVPYVRTALACWYEFHALERLPEIAARWATKLDIALPSAAVRVVTGQTRRWGSCANGVLRFNWQIMQAPRALVEYVVAHEVVHLRHEDHSPAFWATLGRAMPDYDARRARLRELGARWEW